MFLTVLWFSKTSSLRHMHIAHCHPITAYHRSAARCGSLVGNVVTDREQLVEPCYSNSSVLPGQSRQNIYLATRVINFLGGTAPFLLRSY